MRQKLISVGTTETKASLDLNFGNAQSNFTELYNNSVRNVGLSLSVSSIPVSDASAMYAHDSQILIKKIGGVVYRLITYQLDLTSPIEGQSNQFTKLIVFNHSSGEVLVDVELMKGGQTYGTLSIPAGAMYIPRMLNISSTVVRIVASTSSEMYYRDFDLSTLVLGDLAKFQVIIEGESVPRDCNSSAIQAHLENTYGNTSSSYNNLSPLLRSNDAIEVVGGRWYLCFEGSNTVDYTGKFVMLISSGDSGETWELHKPVENTVKKYGEMTANYVGSTWHGLLRGNNGKYLYTISQDGENWSTPADIGLGTETRHTVAKGKDSTGSDVWIVVYNVTGEITGHRTTMVISKTYDFITFTRLAVLNNQKSNHYPSAVYFAGALHLTYTTGFKEMQASDRDTIMYARFPLFNV